MSWCLLFIMASFSSSIGLAEPKNLQPLPEAPPPPAGYTGESWVDEPQVTIIKKGENTIEEYRAHGQLYMQKVTPPHGKAYYLVKQTSGGPWRRMDGPGGEALSVPKWVLFHW